MSDLLVAVYDGEHRAAEVLNAARRREQQLPDLEDAAYITRDATGVTRLHQGRRLLRGGPVAGMWTTLVGLFFASPDAEAAATVQLGDYGIDAAFARRVAIEVKPGSSALFVLRSSASTSELNAAIAGGGLLLQSALAEDVVDRLRSSLDGADGQSLSA